MKLAAEASNKAKSAFLANISHEIRTPLGAVLGFAELMNSPGLPDQEKHLLFNKVRKNGEQLTVLINDLLDISKVESGKIEIEKLPTDLEPLLKDCEQIFKNKASDKGVKLEIKVVDKLPKRVFTDPTRLRQVIINLLSNAIKFTEAGGTVVLEASVEKTRSGHRVFFRVIDTGRGMSELEMEKLFKPFAQADASTTRQYGGTGLGLFLSQRLARALGGDLSIEWSKPGKGSCFVFNFDPGSIDMTSSFSRLERESQHTSAPTTFDDAVLKGTRILIVDDAPDNRELLTIYLHKSGA